MMTNNSFIIREDNKGRLLSVHTEPNTALKGYEIRAILMQDSYSYLYNSFKEYAHLDITDENEYAFLKEIVYDKKVVGFAIYQAQNGKIIMGETKYNLTPYLICVLIYILPEYRGKNIMYYEFEDMLSLFNIEYELLIDTPNFHIISSLMKKGLTKSLNKRFVFIKQFKPCAKHRQFNLFIPCPVYDMKYNISNNPNIPLSTPQCDRDRYDGFSKTLGLFEIPMDYDSPEDYYNEMKQLLGEC